METKEPESVQLLVVFHSPYCQSVAIALAEKGVPFSAIEEDLANKSQRLRDANPVYKKVPALIHNGMPIAESRVIIQYIDDAWPTNSLFPATPYEKAQARFWVDFIHAKVAAPIHLMTQSKDSEQDREAFKENLGLLNSAIIRYSKGEKPFFFGKQLGIVDITFAPFISWFSSFEVFVNLQLPSSIEAPRLHEWITALVEFPTIKPVLHSPASIEQKVAKYRERARARASSLNGQRQ